MHKEVVATAAVAADFMAAVEAVSTAAALVDEVLEAEDLAEELSLAVLPAALAAAATVSAAEREALVAIMERGDSVAGRIVAPLLTVAAGHSGAPDIGGALTVEVTADMVVEHTEGTAVRHLLADADLRTAGCDLRMRPGQLPMGSGIRLAERRAEVRHSPDLAAPRMDNLQACAMHQRRSPMAAGIRSGVAAVR